MTVRIALRPLANPLPLGFLGLTVATTAFSAAQLDWIPADQEAVSALAALLFAAPLQLLASVFGFLARDPVAGTGMGILAGSWSVVAVATLATPPGAAIPGLGVVLIAAAVALLVPVASGISKLVAVLVMLTTSVRFAVTGIAEITGTSGWMHAAGIVGLVLAALAFYAAMAFELEAAWGKAVLPVLRTGAGRVAEHGGQQEQFTGIEHEPGVSKQL